MITSTDTSTVNKQNLVILYGLATGYGAVLTGMPLALTVQNFQALGIDIEVMDKVLEYFANFLQSDFIVNQTEILQTFNEST